MRKFYISYSMKIVCDDMKELSGKLFNNVFFFLLINLLIIINSASLYANDTCEEQSYPDQFQFERCQGQWVRLGDVFQVLNVYKPEQHGMFATNVNGYAYAVRGRLYSTDGMYCMSNTNPNKTDTETWYYRTWVVYTAPDGSSGHWADCRSHVGETVKDPTVGLIDIPIFGRTDILENYQGCANFHRHYVLVSSGGFSIWNWQCK